MGGIAIPESVYSSKELLSYTDKLRRGELRFHWTRYSGSANDKRKMRNLLELVAEFRDLVKVNILNYDSSAFKERRNPFIDKDIERAIYYKLPERIIYGLLRGYGRDAALEVSVQIEECTEYKAFKLDEVLKDHLNVQAIYRGERFFIKESGLIPKQQEVGVEVVDLLLGVIRTILQNKSNSKKSKAKKEFVLSLLNDDNFYDFMASVRYFECTNHRDLIPVDFADCLRLYLGSNFG